MRKIFTISLLVLSICGYAQVNNVQDSLFPKISFEWSEYSTLQRISTDFLLKENEQNVKFVMTELGNKKVKNVLFLWEDMASHSGQSIAFKQIFSLFFENIRENGDKFNVLVFNRRPFNTKSGGKNWLLLSDNFVTGREIFNKINNYTISTVHYSKENHAADLYASIEDAIKLLTENKNNEKMIVLMTAGLNVSLSGATKERASLEEDARKANIPIFVVYYPYQGNSHIPSNITGIAENTGGKVISAVNSMETAAKLLDYYTKLNTRNYQFTFTTNQRRDGNLHRATLQVSNVKSEQVRFVAPSMTLGVWIKENIWLFIALVVAFVGLLAFGFWLIRNKIAERDRKAAIEKARFENEISASNQALSNMKREQEYKEQQRQAEIDRKTREEEDERLARLMQTKNLFPRLQCRVGNDNFTHNINAPYTTIGRGKDNDLILNHETVSGQHAEILFTSGGFEIINKSKSYTKGIIINGQFFQRATLKSGDIIGLGETIVTFYI